MFADQKIEFLQYAKLYLLYDISDALFAEIKMLQKKTNAHYQVLQTDKHA
jgi:hypothetical protein